ncbi:MAG: hydroxymethylbilane synthase [Candidatus Scalindua sp. AMX11]|nr:MAG: hydroxymethylbilane synthase [Candidatus Scalindua sp.]RZV79568.1 MAG: hydroxymethylbilane synthase [Candidatus Scalindua sp. SCAELEC01]TDE65208.1 MAG: hydroxymethylbilane synthase [Candidatus Scalindua sp. AMX11]GJQ58555.1 MAG: porphobilinogen deaminase [Candidatus Scalindua sp.]
MDTVKKVVIGSRGSKLALIQANWVKTELEARYPETEFVIEKIKTTGDKITDVPLAKIGGVGLFTKELENALLDKKVDLVVHSAKDIQTEIPEGLTLGAYTERKDPHDVLISKDNVSLRDLPKNTKIGTSSLRRRSQILAYRKDLEVVDIRGNLDTRLQKIESGELDAIVIAMAGLLRFGQSDKVSDVIPYDIMLPAVGQGALCIEIRDGDLVIEKIVSTLNHYDTRYAVKAERALLAKLQGGCQVPIGAYAEVLYPVNIKIEGVICSLDGTTIYRDAVIGKVDDCEILGEELANKLSGMGGYHILREIRDSLAG